MENIEVVIEIDESIAKSGSSSSDIFEEESKVKSSDASASEDSEFQYIPGMPQLKDLADMSIEDVRNWISLVPHSDLYGSNSKHVGQILTVNQSRRYLAKLIITN